MFRRFNKSPVAGTQGAQGIGMILPGSANYCGLADFAWVRGKRLS
jgi:hypothetical protein